MRKNVMRAGLIVLLILVLPAMLIYWDPLQQRGAIDGPITLSYSFPTSNTSVIHPLSLLFEGDRLFVSVSLKLFSSDDSSPANLTFDFFVDAYILEWNDHSSALLFPDQESTLSHDEEASVNEDRAVMLEENLSQQSIYHQRRHLVDGVFSPIVGEPLIPRTSQYAIVIIPSNAAILKNLSLTLNIELKIALQKMVEPRGYLLLAMAGMVTILLMGMIALTPHLDISRLRRLINRDKASTPPRTTFPSTFYTNKLARKNPLLAYHWNKLGKQELQVLILVVVIINIFVGAFQDLKIFQVPQLTENPEFLISMTNFVKIPSILVFNPFSINFLIFEGMIVATLMSEMLHDDLRSEDLLVLYSLPNSNHNDWKIRVWITLVLEIFMMIVPYMIGAAIIFPLRLGLPFPPIDLIGTAIVLYLLSLLPLYLLFLLVQYYLQDMSASYLVITIFMLWWIIAYNADFGSFLQLQRVSPSLFFVNWSWYLQASYLHSRGLIGTLSDQQFPVPVLSEEIILGLYLLLDGALLLLAKFLPQIKSEVR